MKFRQLLLASIGALFLAFPALSGDKTGTEMLFDSTALNDVDAGTTLRYSHARNADEKIPFKPIKNGEVLVSKFDEDGSARTEVRLVNGDQRRKLHNFPANQGNPVFVTFLESSVNSVTFATKGSPFYIRNRFKDAFGQGGEITETKVQLGHSELDAKRISYAPFKGDRNAKRMGQAFEALTISFVLSDDAPGDFVSMTTEATLDGKQFFFEEVRLLDAKPTSE